MKLTTYFKCVAIIIVSSLLPLLPLLFILFPDLQWVFNTQDGSKFAVMPILSLVTIPIGFIMVFLLTIVQILMKIFKN